MHRGAKCSRPRSLENVPSSRLFASDPEYDVRADRGYRRCFKAKLEILTTGAFLDSIVTFSKFRAFALAMNQQDKIPQQSVMKVRD
jgi:hypothetical protein